MHCLFFFRLKLEETREVQNLRKRPNGVRWVLRGGEDPEEEGMTETPPTPTPPSPPGRCHKYLLRRSPFS